MIAAASTVDWTQVLGDLIAIIPAIVTVVLAAKIHRQIRTPSGKTLGEVAEYTHDTSVANNMLLSKANGPTKEAEPGRLRDERRRSPRIPDPPKGG